MPPGTFNITDIQLAQYRVPAITGYNRLETTPRTVNFDRSLKAEVRDPLWMLTRQWQFGEFQGEDAASAATTKILGEHTVMDSIQFPGSAPLQFDGVIPLETIIEREQLRSSLFLAVQMSRYFIRLIRKRSDFINWFTKLLTQYPLNYQPLENDREGQQLLTTVEGKVFDGFKLYTDISNGTVQADFTTNLSNELELFKSWYQRSYSQPTGKVNSPWQPSQLDYNFSVNSSQSSALQVELEANHYVGGHLDWYCFDANTTQKQVPNTNTKNHLASFIPSPVTFKGMPNPRFWMMEDSRTDFGKIDASPTGLLHLLMAEFGLIYSNDWFILPYPLGVNTLCEIKGIVVTDVFGQYVFIRPATKGPDSEWQRWAMFHHTEMNDNIAANTNLFYLVPAVTRSLNGALVEQVKFLRDEMANMVWAVETIVTSQAGKGVSGDEMALKEQESSSPPAGNTTTAIRYVLGTTVPDNWIPFIPVQIANTSEMQLQRARMPGARGALGKLLTEKAAPYYINEEVIQRSGVQVNFSFQLASSSNGKRSLWLGREKQTGSGEGWSNLKFDQIENI